MFQLIAKISGLVDRIYQLLFLGTTEISDFYIGTAIQNTWYTLLDVTDETGILYAVNYHDTASTTATLEIRITKDGTAKTYTLSNVGIQVANFIALDNTTFSMLLFESYTSSIKIEVRTTDASPGASSAYSNRRAI